MHGEANCFGQIYFWGYLHGDLGSGHAGEEVNGFKRRVELVFLSLTLTLVIDMLFEKLAPQKGIGFEKHLLHTLPLGLEINSNRQFGFLDQICPKSYFQSKKEKVRITMELCIFELVLSTKFQLKLIILSSWTKSTQKKVFPVENITSSPRTTSVCFLCSQEFETEI